MDGSGPVDLEYSKDGSNFVVIHKHVHGSSEVLLHQDIVIFRTAGGKDVYGASPSGKSFDIMPLARKQWSEMALSKTAKWNDDNGDYCLFEVTSTKQSLVIGLHVRGLASRFPNSVKIEIPWEDVESLAKQ